MEEIIGHLEEDLGMIVKLFVRFSAFQAAIFATGSPLGCKWAVFGDIYKTLTINRLNFVDTIPGPKTDLKGPKRP